MVDPLVLVILDKSRKTVLKFIKDGDEQEINKVENAFDDLLSVLEIFYRYGSGEDMVKEAVNKALRKSLKAARSLAEDPPEEE